MVHGNCYVEAVDAGLLVNFVVVDLFLMGLVIDES